MIRQASRRNVHGNPGKRPSLHFDTGKPSGIRMQDRPKQPGILLYSCHQSSALLRQNRIQIGHSSHSPV